MSNPASHRAAFTEVEHLEPRRLLSDIVPVGPEFRVNSHTPHIQNLPAVAMDASGSFVIVWESRNQTSSGSHGVYAQRFNAAGVALGAEFRVNTHTTSFSWQPSVAMDADGDFVIAFTGYGPDDDGAGIVARRYNAAGVPQGAEFRVNTFTTGHQRSPSIAMKADGDFIITWGSSQSLTGSDSDLYARRFNAAGAPLGSEFQINTFTTSAQIHPDVAMDADGNFVVAWWSEGQDHPDGSAGIFAQRFSAAGAPVGPEFQVNTYTTNPQRLPAVAMDADGDFVITWTSYGQDPDGSTGVYAQRFNAEGVPRGNEFRVHIDATGDQRSPSVGLDFSGNFVVTWENVAAFRDVFAQRYDAAGIPLDGEFRVNTFTLNTQREPSLAVDADGDFLIAWTSDQDGSFRGVYAQRFGIVPTVANSSFRYANAPHGLRFTFDRDVSASLGSDDLVVQNLTTMQTIPSNDFSLAYDTATNVATFMYTGTTAGIPGMLPDGRYAATLLAAGVTTIQGAPLGADHVLSFRFLQGDANNDGRVNLEDFNILAGNFGQSPRDFTQGDFDYSGNVNLNDFNLLAARFGQVLAAPGAGAAARDGSYGRDAWLDDLLA